jgi:Bacterial regulatory helix-turn-helix protein, lysR family
LGSEISALPLSEFKNEFLKERGDMQIEIRQLRFAVAMDDTMSFSRAAASLNVKQTTLSKSITTLEEQLGVKLFESFRRVPFRWSLVGHS